MSDVKAAQANGDHVVFVAGSHGRAERTVELLKDYDVRAVMASDAGDVIRGAVMVAEGWLSKGFRLRTAGRLRKTASPQAQPALQVYAETDVFDEERRKTGAGKKRSASAAFLSDLRDLKVNDLIVHVDHGIGQFVGLKQISVAGGDIVQEFLELRYHGDAKLFVPVERLDLIQKYTGGSKPPLDRLGGTTWEKAKTKVKKAMRDMAEELLKLYAARKAVPGHAFAPTRTGRKNSRTRSSSISRRTRRPRSPTSSATWKRRRRWIACCAATSATARPKWRCAPPSRR